MDQQTKIHALKDLIRINTANDHEKQAALYLQRFFKNYGISSQLVEYAPDRDNIVAEIDSGQPGPVLVLAGHLDTVALGNRDSWEHDPLSADEVDGEIYGRGSVDMKSGLAAMAIALIEMKDAGLPKKGKVRFLGTVGEELGAMGSEQLTKKGFVDDATAIIVGEPTGGDIVYANNGSIGYTVKSYGKSVHSSMPQAGVNAVANLAKFLVAEEHAFDDAPASPILGKPVHSVNVFHGGSQLNIIPDYAETQGNIRPVPECNNEDSIARIQKTVDELNKQPGVDLKLEVQFSFRPVVNDPDSAFVKLVQDAHQQAFGQEPGMNIIHGASDASNYIKAVQCPMLLLGAGDWSLAHQVNEHVEIDNYLKVNETYENVIKQYLS